MSQHNAPPGRTLRPSTSGAAAGAHTGQPQQSPSLAAAPAAGSSGSGKPARVSKGGVVVAQSPIKKKQKQQQDEVAPALPIRYVVAVTPAVLIECAPC